VTEVVFAVFVIFDVGPFEFGATTTLIEIKEGDFVSILSYFRGKPILVLFLSVIESFDYPDEVLGVFK